uniref:Uncharacterized protein n=1 Tax=Ditylenchus dipsaci TaxID=166011 RepID=A0A915EQG5_9BILA
MSKRAYISSQHNEIESLNKIQSNTINYCPNSATNVTISGTQSFPGSSSTSSTLGKVCFIGASATATGAALGPVAGIAQGAAHLAALLIDEAFSSKLVEKSSRSERSDHTQHRAAALTTTLVNITSIPIAIGTQYVQHMAEKRAAKRQLHCNAPELERQYAILEAEGGQFFPTPSICSIPSNSITATVSLRRDWVSQGMELSLVFTGFFFTLATAADQVVQLAEYEATGLQYSFRRNGAEFET